MLFRSFDFLAAKDFKLFGFERTWSDEGCSVNMLCALHLIYTFVFIYIYISCIDIDSIIHVIPRE
jgi:hypothetical protein